jgi:hypothetical protein
MELEEILRRLINNGVEFVLVGGFASVVHGAPMVTRAIDVCLRFSRGNLEKLARAFHDVHPTHRMTPQRLAFEVTDQNWGSFKSIYLEMDIGILDCLGEILGIGDYEEVLAQSDLISLPVGSFRILRIGSLIKAKETTARPHDLQAAAHLRLIQQRRKTES